MSDIIKSVSVDSVMLSKTNPRSKLSEGNLEELSKSIADHGIIRHLLVRPIMGDKYELVDGERRLKAALKLEMEEVPVIIREMTDREALELQIIDFLHKKEIHPVEECTAFMQLMLDKNYTPQIIAEKISKPVHYVEQRLSFQYLINPIRKAFEENKITIGHASLLARMQEEDQRELYEWLHLGFKNEYRPVNDLKERINSNYMTNLQQVGFSKSDSTLIEGVPSCKECPKRTGFNQELFNDISSKEICTDKKCFAVKVAAHISREEKKIVEETGEKPVKVSSKMWTSDKKLLTSDNYDVVKGKEKPENTKKAIIYDGENKGKVVSIVVKKDLAEQKTDHARVTGSSTTVKKKSDVEIKNEEIKAQREEKIANRVLDGILVSIRDERKPIRLNAFEIEKILDFTNFQNSDDKLMANRRGWKFNGYIGYSDVVEKAKKVFKEDLDEWHLFLIEYSWLEDVTDDYSCLRKAAINHYQVDVASIEKQVADELPFVKEEKAEKPVKEGKKKAA